MEPFNDQIGTLGASTTTQYNFEDNHENYHFSLPKTVSLRILNSLFKSRLSQWIFTGSLSQHKK